MKIQSIVGALGLNLLFLTACTKPNSSDLKIVGGRLVDYHEKTPERISTIGLVNIKINGLCTGTIVAHDLILTAAHCAPAFNSKSNSTANFNNWIVKRTYTAQGNPSSAESLGTLIRIEDSRIHPNYVANSIDTSTDVALVKLASSIPKGYSPIKILRTVLLPGQIVTQAGYGLTNNKPGNFIKIRAVTSTVRTATNSIIEIDNYRLGKGACVGDSGGPLYVTVKNQSFVAGISSNGEKENGKCIGNDNYAATAAHYNMLLQFAREMTGRSDPFGDGAGN